MQRLYSTFPNSLPGVGLLLVRIAVGVALLFINRPLCGFLHAELIGHGTEIVLATLLIIGLWIPITAILAALVEIWPMLCTQSVDLEHIVTALVAIALAMLGPGAWSLDAVFFGRKRIDITAPP
jgi:uncharacterized membrane protein YphA (DoxX/SURF4 family)